MTLELNRLTGQVEAMGRALAASQRTYADLLTRAGEWLREYAGQGERLRHPAREYRAAIPTDDRLDAVHPLPPHPERATVVAADGSQIQPDRHGAALFYLINVGSLVYRHGSGETPVAESEPRLCYQDDDLYEERRLVQGNLLDVQRDLAEITRLADLAAAEGDVPTVALVDGTLLLWVLEESPPERRRGKVGAYLRQLDRVRAAGAALAAFISRPRYAEVTRLLWIAHLGDELEPERVEANPLERLPDRALFHFLPAGTRSALFVSPSPVNQEYGPALSLVEEPTGHTVHFCYLNVAEPGQEPVVARVEVPAWVAEEPALLDLAHAAVVEQSRLAGGYPYALARADELSFISGREREALAEMVGTALLRAGVTPALSPKAFYKSLTRGGRRSHRL